MNSKVRMSACRYKGEDMGEVEWKWEHVLVGTNAPLLALKLGNFMLQVL